MTTKLSSAADAFKRPWKPNGDADSEQEMVISVVREMVEMASILKC